jgi:hypothetical protein
MRIEEQKEAIKFAPVDNLIHAFESLITLLEDKVIDYRQVDPEEFNLLRKELERRQFVYFN